MWTRIIKLQIFIFLSLFTKSVLANSEASQLKFVSYDKNISRHPIEIEFSLYRKSKASRPLSISVGNVLKTDQDEKGYLRRLDREILKEENGLKDWSSFNNVGKCHPKLEVIHSSHGKEKKFAFCPLEKNLNKKEKKMKALFKYLYDSFNLSERLNSRS